MICIFGKKLSIVRRYSFFVTSHLKFLTKSTLASDIKPWCLNVLRTAVKCAKCYFQVSEKIIIVLSMYEEL